MFNLLNDMRAIWRGSISFGLVNIPDRAVPGVAGAWVEIPAAAQKDLSPVA